jgi:hypothetical protein
VIDTHFVRVLEVRHNVRSERASHSREHSSGGSNMYNYSSSGGCIARSALDAIGQTFTAGVRFRF